MPAKVRKAVFPAAGLGTRFLPATKAQPKEMLPIVDKPIIQYGVEEAIHSGIQNIIDRKSTRLNSSHLVISYAVFCLKKKNTKNNQTKLDRRLLRRDHTATLLCRVRVPSRLLPADTLVRRDPSVLVFFFFFFFKGGAPHLLPPSPPPPLSPD